MHPQQRVLHNYTSDKPKLTVESSKTSRAGRTHNLVFQRHNMICTDDDEPHMQANCMLGVSLSKGIATHPPASLIHHTTDNTSQLFESTSTITYHITSIHHHTITAWSQSQTS